MRTRDDRFRNMSIGPALKGAIATANSAAALLLRTAGKRLRRTASVAARAAWLVYAGARDRAMAGGRAVGRALQRTVLITAYGIARGGRSVINTANKTLRMAAAAIARGYWSVINAATKTLQLAAAAIARGYGLVIKTGARALHRIKAGILYAGQAILRTMRWTRHAAAVAALNTGRLALVPSIAFKNAIIRLTRSAGSRICARYRSLAFDLAATTMTVSLEDGHARLLVLKGNRIIAWRSSQIAQPPEIPEAGPNGDSANAAGPEKGAAPLVYSPLEPLLEDLRVRGKRVIIDLPLYVPLLRHVPLPAVKGRFLKEIINAEVLDSVPFAQDEVDVHWRIEEGEGGREASVIAVPKARMDDQVAIVRDSHLAPSAIYPKAAALAAAVGRPDVFILHMTQAQTTVVLVRGGVPRIVHRIELQHDTTERAEAIAMGVDQVGGYHRSQRPDDDVSGLPVVVTGEVKQMQDLLGPLATTLGRPIQIFHSGLDNPDGFDPAEYASNIGLYLASRSKESAKVIAAQDVLPERHRPRPLPVIPVAVFAGLFALGFLAFNLSIMVSGVAGELDSLKATLEIRSDQAREYRLKVARYSVIDQRIADADLEALELEANLVSLEQEMDTLLSRISAITGNAGLANVKLSRLVPMPEGFSVSGSAESYSDVLGYAASMRSSPNFEDAAVLQVADSSGSRLGFTVVVTVPTPEPEGDEETDAQARNP